MGVSRKSFFSLAPFKMDQLISELQRESLDDAIKALELLSDSHRLYEQVIREEFLDPATDVEKLQRVIDLFVEADAVPTGNDISAAKRLVAAGALAPGATFASAIAGVCAAPGAQCTVRGIANYFRRRLLGRAKFRLASHAVGLRAHWDPDRYALALKEVNDMHDLVRRSLPNDPEWRDAFAALRYYPSPAFVRAYVTMTMHRALSVVEIARPDGTTIVMPLVPLFCDLRTP